MNGRDIQNLIFNELGSGADWSALDILVEKLGHPDHKTDAKEKREQKEAEKRRFQTDLLTIFSTDEGMRVLQHLLSATLRQDILQAPAQQLQSQTAEQIAMISAYRMGQNSILRAIIKDLATAGFSFNFEKGETS